jgi:prepilin-type N-terminal cleavage/methylation domain-containing protein
VRKTQIRASGFTLIEILIVVMILGIMAAIAVPAIGTYSKTARTSTLVTTCHTIRSQIQAYRLQHGDALPDLAAASAGGNHFQPLTAVTVYRGQDRGPYLQSAPVNPHTEGSTVMNAVSFSVNGIPDPVPGADFIYDFTNDTGLIWGTSDRATGTPIVQ